MARRQPAIVTRETDVPAPPGSKEIALAIFSRWIVRAEKQRLEEPSQYDPPLACKNLGQEQGKPAEDRAS